MKTDRELLELAAKAAGIEVGEWFDDGVSSAFSVHDDYWNPLTDDGDALRLAVKLNLTVGHDIADVGNNLGITWVRLTGEFKGKYAAAEFWADNMDDPYIATRRAIVRAAAEIGKRL